MTRVPHSQRGAAAIFIVVFFAILISVIALSFMRIAVQDQQQATNDDLSQSAYDSANAGLEDAKRAISWYNANCPLNSQPSVANAPKCAVYTATFNATDNRCNLADIIHDPATADTLPYAATTTPTSSEVKVSTNATAGSDDTKLDQAYTCVTVTTQTRDYKATATNGKNDNLIPLRTVDDLPIDTIELKWFYYESGDNSATLNPTYPDSVAKPLPISGGAWQPTTPPIMRFQLIPTIRGNMNINDVSRDTKTVFLYPSTTGSGNIDMNLADPGRSDPPPAAKPKAVAPQLAKCEATVSSGMFACSARLNVSLLTAAGGTGTPLNTDYYLRLTSIYNNADYQIRLLGSAGEVRLFDNVAPQIDTTGRANDVFRRVQSRVISTTSSNPLTDGGFDITQGVCKSFNVPVYDTNCALPLVNP